MNSIFLELLPHKNLSCEPHKNISCEPHKNLRCEPQKNFSCEPHKNLSCEHKKVKLLASWNILNTILVFIVEFFLNSYSSLPPYQEQQVESLACIIYFLSK